MLNIKPKIIAIAAVSGGGKTTVTSRLSQVLNNSKTFYFDDYDFEGPDDIIDWVERGADCNEWNLEPLISDLRNLMSAEEVEFIIIDYPFARLHKNLKNIDLSIFIDTPLDIAMARRIIRDFRNMNSEAILGDISNYLSHGRRGYESMLLTTKPNSDLIIDGSLSVDEIVNIICNEIKI
jgi:uridine kinase